MANYEVSKVYELIVSSKTLSRRKNIGFHLAYQEGDYYPINHLRNIALNNVISPFVFLLDNDFVPSYDFLCFFAKFFVRDKRYLKDGSCDTRI